MEKIGKYLRMQVLCKNHQFEAENLLEKILETMKKKKRLSLRWWNCTRNWWIIDWKLNWRLNLRLIGIGNSWNHAVLNAQCSKCGCGEGVSSVELADDLQNCWSNCKIIPKKLETISRCKSFAKIICLKLEICSKKFWKWWRRRRDSAWDDGTIVGIDE